PPRTRSAPLFPYTTLFRSVGDTGVRLERRIPAEEDRVAHAQTGRVTPRASAEHVLFVQLVSDANAGLDLTPLNVRVVVGDAAKQDRKSTRLNSSHLGISYA